MDLAFHFSSILIVYPSRLAMAILSAICIILVTMWCWRLYSNHKQLNHVPGPYLAGFSDFWRAWLQSRGELRSKLVELHKQYGPVVRYGVRSVSINDPSALDIVYGSRAGFVIADAYKVIVGVSQGKEVDSVVTIRNESRHNRLRRSVANAFTVTATLDYEPHIDRTIEELLKSLGNQRTFDLARKMVYFGLDAASGFAFNSPMGCLAADADVHGMIAVTRERMRHWTVWASVPGLERLIFRNPVALRMKGGTQSSNVKAAISRLHERKKSPQKDSETPDLLTRFLEALEQDPDTLNEGNVISLLMSMVAAGSDTVAITSTATMYYLMKNPKVSTKLQEELEASNLSTPIPAYSQISKLPYLHAVIKESMRLFPNLTHPLERLVPSGGVNISGVFLPQGTSVGSLQLAMHLNPRVFGEDADAFRPERWLEADAEELRVMEMAHLGFGRGRRACIGQNIATMELKKVVSAMLMKYKVSFGHAITSSNSATDSETVEFVQPSCRS